MKIMNLRWFICLGTVLMLAVAVWGAEEELVPMADAELDAVCAAGLNFQVNLDVDLSANHPDFLFISDKLGSLRPLAEAGQRSTSTAGSLSGGSPIDTDGTLLPDFQSAINNNISITDNALQNAQSLLNIIALGDVAVGINITVIVDPTNSPFNITQTNINWSELLPTMTPVVP